MSEWLLKGASQGDANCQFTLGVMALNRHDYDGAMEWLLKAAAQASHAAQDKIGLMYRDGLGVPQDNIQAFMWFTISANISGQYFTPLRDALAQKMTGAEMDEAKRRAAEWKPVAVKRKRLQDEPEGLLT
ncbi:MAG: sel1 repeat family protein [Alphaproteobacteria bacterium]|nr:MAG: sel1 repeat family protein [Alphaproteobacteria bacterium]